MTTIKPSGISKSRTGRLKNTCLDGLGGLKPESYIKKELSLSGLDDFKPERKTGTSERIVSGKRIKNKRIKNKK